MTYLPPKIKIALIGNKANISLEMSPFQREV